MCRLYKHNFDGTGQIMKSSKKLKSVISEIKTVDKFLPVFLFLFLVQIGYGLFTDTALSPQTTSIDVVIRTFASAVFGYFLSETISTPPASTLQIYEPKQISLPTEDTQIKNRMGFSESPTPEKTGYVSTLPSNSARSFRQTFQISIVAGVGIISLVILLILRNTMPVTNSMIAPLTQLRDMLSSSIGFLVGSKHD